jgi:hypothetical protein
MGAVSRTVLIASQRFPLAAGKIHCFESLLSDA